MVNFLASSFHVAASAHAAATAITSSSAAPQPTAAGRNTAMPSLPGAPPSASRAAEAPRAKHATAAQSFTCPSPARQIEPAPQPPARVMPMPNSVPPRSPPTPAAANTQSPGGGAKGEARDGGPELHLSLAGAPDRARAAAAGQGHADAEQRAAEEPADTGGREHPVALVLEVGELEDREAERAHDERQRRRPCVLGVAGHERLAEGAHEAEARALEDHAERGAEEEEDTALRMAGGRVGEGDDQQRGEQQHAGERLAARVATRPRPRPPAAARPVRAPRGLPEQIAQAEKGADAEAEHHREAGEAQGTHRGAEAADVAAEGERGAHAHQHAAGRALDQLAARGHADRELARTQRARRAAEQHAEVEQRAGVEPRRQQIRTAHEA